MSRDMEGIHAAKAVNVTETGDGTSSTTGSNDDERRALKKLDNEPDNRTFERERDDSSKLRGHEPRRYPVAFQPIKPPGQPDDEPK